MSGVSPGELHWPVSGKGLILCFRTRPIALRLGTLDALGEETDAPIIPCDVSDEEDVEKLMQQVKEELGSVDFILHAIGMSPNIRKKKEYKDLNYNWYNQTLDISAISLHKVLHFAERKRFE